MIVCDFHTHHQWSIPAILSTATAADAPYTSLEFHPWHLPETFSGLPETALLLNNFTALGEIGLDRLRGPEFPVQQQYLKTLLQLAADCRKPVIFHCVRAFPELFSLVRPYSFPWAVHGFRGKTELLDEIWNRGGIVSFHSSITNNQPLLKKLAAPRGKFAFESDDDKSVDLAQVVDDTVRASGNRNLPHLAYNTFMEFVSYGK